MTHREKLLVSAYSGVLLCDYRDFLSYASEVLGHPVAITDLQHQSVWDALKLRVSAEFGALSDEPDSPEMEDGTWNMDLSVRDVATI